MKKNKAVFVDRDGTVNQEKCFVHMIKDFKLIPAAAKALKILHDAGYMIIIVTNQSGIGRGLYTLKDLHAVNRHMRKKLREKGVRISAIYYCPHHPCHGCDCRKPMTGNIKKAVKRFNINIKKSWVIGDNASDIELGKNAGTRTIRVLTGKKEKKGDAKADFTAKDLLKAAETIRGLS